MRFNLRSIFYLVALSLSLKSPSVGAHEGHEHGHEEMEAVEFLLVAVTYRDAFIAKWLTDDLIDTATVTQDGSPPGSRALDPRELAQLEKANLLFISQDPVNLPPRRPPQLAVVDLIPKAPIPLPQSKKSGQLKAAEPSESCEGQGIWTPPRQVMFDSEQLAAALIQRLPMMKDKIERNLLFLKSELGVLDGKLKEIATLSHDRGYLARPCLYSLLSRDYAFKIETLTLPFGIALNHDQYQKACQKTGRPTCMVLEAMPSTPGPEGSESHIRPPTVVLAAGLKTPAQGNFLSEMHTELNAWRSLFPPS